MRRLCAEGPFATEATPVAPLLLCSGRHTIDGPASIIRRFGPVDLANAADDGSRHGPLLERDTEVATLAATVEAARAGEGQLVAIEGVPESARRACSPRCAPLPRKPGWTCLLRGRASWSGVRLRRRPPAVRASARQVLGGGAGRPASGAAALAAPLFDQSQLRLGDGASGDASFPTLHGLYWLAANIALRRPLLVAVDDLHWADAVSLRWLGYLARRLEGLPLLLVLATRPRSEGDEKAMLDELLADPAGVVVRPGPLGTAAVAVLSATCSRPSPRKRSWRRRRQRAEETPVSAGALGRSRTRAARSDGRERHQGAPDRPGGRPTGPICPALTPARAGPRASARRRDPR